MAEINNQIIEKARKKFYEIYKTDNSDLYDEQDVQHVMQKDWWLIRYLNQNMNVNQSMINLTNNFKWRKENKLRFVKDCEFPAELYKLGAMFKYNFDKNGRPVLIIRVKLVRRIHEVTMTLKEFLKYLVYTTDQEGDENGWCLILDFTGSGLENVDFDLAKYFVDLLVSYFPGGLANVLCVDSPFIFKAFWMFIKSWTPKNRSKVFRFVPKSKIKEYVDEANLPDFLGGTCSKKYNGVDVIPKDCIIFKDYGVKYMNMIEENAIKLHQNIKSTFSL